MTQLRKRKTKATFETSAIVQGRPVVIECHEYEVSARLKGTRTSFSVPWQAVYSLGAKLAVIEQKREKNAKR